MGRSSGSQGAGARCPGDRIPLTPQRPENLTATSSYSPGLRVDAVGEHVSNLEDRGRSLPIRIIGGERGTKLGEGESGALGAPAAAAALS